MLNQPGSNWFSVQETSPKSLAVKNFEARVGIEPSPFLKICRPQTAIVSFRLEEIVRARSVQSNAAVDDQLRAGNVARILRE